MNQEINRQMRDADREHHDSLPRWRTSLTKLFTDRDTPIEAKSQLVTGLNRRGFLKLGGTTLAAGALLAACSSDGDSTVAGGTATTTDGGGDSSTDVTVLRTAASLENFAVNVYDTAIANAEALGITAGVGAAATLFRDHHKAHAETFNGTAVQLGGEAFTDPNPAAAQAFAEAIAGLKTEADVLSFAYELEQIAAQTYQGVGVAMLSTPTLRQASMSVGGVEARHAALLATLIDGTDPSPQAFQVTDKAVDASFFV